MLDCWQERPNDRPDFARLHTKIDELLMDAAVGRSITVWAIVSNSLFWFSFLYQTHTNIAVFYHFVCMQDKRTVVVQTPFRTPTKPSLIWQLISSTGLPGDGEFESGRLRLLGTWPRFEFHWIWVEIVDTTNHCVTRSWNRENGPL